MNRLLLLACLAGAVTASAQVPDYVPTDGLIAWYPLDGNATDLGDNGFNGTESGTTGAVSRDGTTNGALEFNGSSHVNLGNSNVLNPAEMSISCWFQIQNWNTQTGLSTILGRNLDNGSHRYGFNMGIFGPNNTAIGQTGLRFGFDDDSNSGNLIPEYNIPEPLNLNEWYHFGITMNLQEEELIFYLNGTVIATENIPSAGVNPIDTDVLMGFYRPNGDHSLNGLLDDVGIWNRQLSAEEVQQVFASEPPFELPTSVPTEGLVAFYPFNGNAEDESGNGHDGTMDGALFGQDREGSTSASASFDGVDDGIFIPHHPDFESAEKTISFWISPAIEQFLDTPGLADGMGVINKTDHTGSNLTNRYYALHLGGTNSSQASPYRLDFAISTGAQPDPNRAVEATVTGPMISANEWHHVSAVQTNNQLKLYIDGALASSSPLLNAPIENDYDIKIGVDYKFNEYRYFNGSIDDISFHNRALSEDEIAAMAGVTTTAAIPSYVSPNGLMGWYPFNGNTLDESGNDHHGVAEGTALTIDRFGASESALHFNGIDDELDMPAFFNVGWEEFTISGWFSTDDFNKGNQTIVNTNPHNGIGIGFDHPATLDHTVSLWLNSDPAVSSWDNSSAGHTSITFADNDWHHVSLTKNGLDYVLKVDGSVVFETTAAITPVDYTCAIILGHIDVASGEYFKGTLDDFGFWNRALSEEELEALISEAGIHGCTNPAACNYDSAATEDDGSCTYADYGRDCNGNCAGATRWFVDAAADPAVATGDTLTPFATIQEALDMACPNDTVLIAPGTYVENVSSTVENLTIRGYAPSMPIDDVAANVIIDGNALGTAFFISGQYTSVSDLSITNGLSTFGAGLYMSGAHGSIVQRCQIRDNHAAGDITGHGLALLSNDCLIENCSITENHGTKHTVDCRGSNNTINHCRITDNIATAEGGGVVVYTHQMLIQDCVISDNEGGGLTTYRDDTVIDHCTISGNSNYGIYIWGYSDDAAIFITNSVISNPSIEFKMKQTGNIVTTAHLRSSIVEGGVDYDWLSVYKVFDVDGTLNTLDPVLLSDYTLASTSSAIGTAGGNRYDFAGTLGAPSSTLDLDYAGRPQPAGTEADLGAIEHPLGTPEPTFGCTDDTACNFDPAATDDDASCIAPTCDDPTACNYDANATCGGGTCIPSGCMEEDACNYNPDAQCDGEACDYTCCPGPGCCDDPSQWNAALQQCNTAAPDTIVVTDTLLVPTPFCGAGTHWDPVTEMCIADGPGEVDENCTLMNLQDLVEGHQILLEHSADQDSIILALQDSLASCADGPAAVNSQACAGEDHVTFDGYDYSVVGIGDQCWFAENLRTTTYLNGDAIPEVTDDAQWGSLSTGARCEHPAPEINTALSGLLYNWWVVNDSRGVCPSGWHVPSHDEWKQLEATIGMSQAEIDGLSANRGTSAYKIKSAIHWDGTDEFGFNAVPAGSRSGNADGAFDTSDNVSAFWTSTPSTGAWYRALRDNQPAILAWNDGDGGDFGMSIRCVKD